MIVNCMHMQAHASNGLTTIIYLRIQRKKKTQQLTDPGPSGVFLVRHSTQSCYSTERVLDTYAASEIDTRFVF